MAHRTCCVAVLLSILPIAGCGTVSNLARSLPEEGGRTPFGGVRHDVVCIKQAAKGELAVGAHAKAEQEPQVALMLLCAADVPFSFVGDVVTWPYTAAYSFINQPVPVPPVIQAAGSPPPQRADETLPKPALIPTLKQPKELP